MLVARINQSQNYGATQQHRKNQIARACEIAGFKVSALDVLAHLRMTLP
jgi:hypothetical protein